MKRSATACGAIFVSGIGWFSTADAASERVLYSLPANAYAFDRVLEDGAGSLYATTYSGGQFGTVIELQKRLGVWHHFVLSIPGWNRRTEPHWRRNRRQRRYALRHDSRWRHP